MATAKARVKVHDDRESILPILIPELDEVRRFAAEVHSRGAAWAGEAFGWPAEYCPQRPEPPLDSNLTFTPADFCIGESAFGSSRLCGNTVRTLPLWSSSTTGRL